MMLGSRVKQLWADMSRAHMTFLSVKMVVISVLHS